MPLYTTTAVHLYVYDQMHLSCTHKAYRVRARVIAKKSTGDETPVGVTAVCRRSRLRDGVRLCMIQIVRLLYSTQQQKGLMTTATPYFRSKLKFAAIRMVFLSQVESRLRAQPRPTIRLTQRNTEWKCIYVRQTDTDAHEKRLRGPITISLSFGDTTHHMSSLPSRRRYTEDERRVMSLFRSGVHAENERVFDGQYPSFSQQPPARLLTKGPKKRHNVTYAGAGELVGYFWVVGVFLRALTGRATRIQCTEELLVRRIETTVMSLV